MGRDSVTLAVFNRGKISPTAQARTQEVKRVALSADEQTNFMPTSIGAMSLRAGLEYISHTAGDKMAKHLRFVKDSNDEDQKAIIELTDLQMRVRQNEAVIQRALVSTTIRGGGFDADITNWNKLTNPASLPPGACLDCAWSPSGGFLAVTSSTTPFIKVYAIVAGVPTVLNSPLAALAGQGNNVAFSPDGQFMAVAHNTTPFIAIYSISGSGIGATFTKFSNPATIPAANASGVAFSPNSQYVAFGAAGGSSNNLFIYSIAGTGVSATFTKISDPAALPAGSGLSLDFSHDGQFLAVGHATSPFVTIYSISGGTFTKLTNPASLPPDVGTGVRFNRSCTFLAVACGNTSPYYSIYSISGSTFTKLANAASIPTPSCTGVDWSPDDQFVTFSEGTTPFVVTYDFATGAPVKIADFGTLPASTGEGCAYAPDGRYLAIAHQTTPFITIYDTYQWLDRDQSTSASTYGTSSSSVSAGPIVIANNPTNWANFTIRQRIDSAAFLISGTRIQVRFACDGSGTFTCSKAYIGEAAAAGDAYDFASAPTQLTFSGGSAGFTITGSQTIDCDEVNFTLDRTKNYVISFVSPSSATDDFGMAGPGTANWSLYYKSGDDATTVNATGYTDYSATRDVGGITQIAVITSGAAGYLAMIGTQFSVAKRVQTIYIAPADLNVQHALRVIVARGKVILRVGTLYGLDDLMTEVTLSEGTHSLTFTPTVNLIFIEVQSNTLYTTLLDSVNIESSGDMLLTAPWGESDQKYLRYEQSEDVIWVACKGRQQYRIERRDDNSWSIVKYLPADGPFLTENVSAITMTPSGLTGDITLTASRAYFKSTNVGSLMRLGSNGQEIAGSFTAANQFTSGSIKVTGTDTSRTITVTLSGTWSATVTLQRSVAEPGTWTDVKTFTSNGTTTYNDGLDNQVIYYRIGVKAGNYTSGTVVADVSYTSGSINGFARITAYTSPTLVSAIVLTAMGGTGATEDWAEGLWSDRRGWPTAVVLNEGRLVWPGKNRVVESVPDGFDVFNPETEGASAPINRTIGSGPNDTINWAVAADRLLLGGQALARAVRSSSLDELVTADNFNLKPAGGPGSAAVQAVLIEASAVYVGKSGRRMIELSPDGSGFNYSAIDLTQLIPEMLAAGVKVIDVQDEPDTRLHCVMNDGTACILIFNKAENVICWIDFVTDGLVEDVIVMPQIEGESEDLVYYAVKRNINGADVRYFERWNYEEDCLGQVGNRLADANIKITNGSPQTVITGLDHLEGKSVVAWGDDKYAGTYTVSGGSITLAVAATVVVVGLTYRGRFKSGKLPYAFQGGSAFNRTQKIAQIGFLLINTHRSGIRFGPDFNNLRALASMYRGKAVTADQIFDEFDDKMDPFPDIWSTNSRVCIEGNAPYPSTVAGVTLVMDTN